MGKWMKFHWCNFCGQIFRELTFHSKATSEKPKGAVWVCGAEVSADWKTNLGIVHPRNIYICGQFESHFRQSAGWNGLGNLATLPWQCGVGDLGLQTWQHELDNLAMWTGQISEIKLAKEKNSNLAKLNASETDQENLKIPKQMVIMVPKKPGANFEHFWVANWPQGTNKC